MTADSQEAWFCRAGRPCSVCRSCTGCRWGSRHPAFGRVVCTAPRHSSCRWRMGSTHSSPPCRKQCRTLTWTSWRGQNDRPRQGEGVRMLERRLGRVRIMVDSHSSYNIVPGRKRGRVQELWNRTEEWEKRALEVVPPVCSICRPVCFIFWLSSVDPVEEA